jgi:predicted SAM-dependent methyltransferase
MNVKVKPLLIGIATYIPWLYRFISRGTGGTISARYCYSVWLRHLSMAYKNGFPTHLDTIAELGPGDSIGIGLAALLSGTNKYYAFDVVKYANTKTNILIFDELVELFKKREKIPDEIEFPMVVPYLESYEFPKHILTDKIVNKALVAERIESIRNTILSNNDNKDNLISYIVPWNDSNIIQEESIDMIYSQAVLEHVDDLTHTYKSLYRWLKPSGFMSHQIDFKCHGTARKWNGHWAYSDFVWGLIKGKKSYLLNREPLSRHIILMQKIGFDIICNIKIKDTTGIQRKELSSKFINMSDDDLTTIGAFIQALKKRTSSKS